MRLLPRMTAALAFGLAAAITTTPAHANLLDPIVDIAPPLKIPYYPSTETACADADPQCIEATIATMTQQYEAFRAKCDHDAVFALAYLRVTEEVQQAIFDGDYDDDAWLHHQDAVFAEDYFQTLDNWHAGRTNKVPTAWRIALRAADDEAVTALGNFLLAMNAHINRDFPYVLAGVGLTAEDGTSHKPDHNRFNARLDGLYHPVFTEIATELDPAFDDFDLGPLDEEAVGGIMRGWREVVWRNAEALALAKTPLQRALVSQGIETYAATQATLIRTTFAAGKNYRSARNDHCRAGQAVAP